MKLLSYFIFKVFFLSTFIHIATAVSFHQKPFQMQATHQPRLFELLAGSRDCNIFSDILMQFPELVERLKSSDEHTTVLVPTDLAFQNLKVKPWKLDTLEAKFEMPSEPVHITEEQAQGNLHHFIKSHFVSVNPSHGNGECKSLSGSTINVIKQKDILYLNDSVQVLSIKRASNGEVWILNNTLSAPSVRKQV
ncbi:cell surface fascilin domain protein, implicated in adhesion Mug57 [Schizosaccharomyces osmophilus]|uniref:Cell surface fascilin domain protein, implicated in adhesion Mug57 n=1 Tax=Schizosaccharomyces osmophilus TaxID=2545709 RepID=A0AAE9W6V3_9SCHI|nr:cell surface fascilin domain protein, implicated in adhesion Mug57 [Schizosaccharomyces osmophilus]WBW70964.1 cell surface fascilin domain protein, implicated in adhesion Mug57 [Schizosaccharomyces osmophilus]